MNDEDLEFLRDYVRKNVKEGFTVTVDREEDGFVVRYPSVQGNRSEAAAWTNRGAAIAMLSSHLRYLKK
jgi:hypothetical protein